MGIVERAASRLGAVPKPDRTPSADGQGNGFEVAHKPDLIERTIATGNRSAGSSGNADEQATTGGRFAAGEFEAKFAATSRKESPALHIKTEWLRQRNFITPDGERTPVAESFRRIKRHVLANVLKPKSGVAVNRVMITSALPGEGKTFCAINLALSMAMELERSVLLVDADTVRPSVLQALGLKPELRGLMDVLDDRRADLAEVVHQTNIENLSILPAGTAHPRSTELLGSESMRKLVHEMAESHTDRIVIFDSPPLLVASESANLATHMSMILMVAAASQTTELALKDALRRLEGCDSPVGMLLNKVEGAGPGYGYYGYGYG